MRRFGTSVLAAIAVAAVVGTVSTSGAWAQGPWAAPADTKGLKSPVNGPGGVRKSIEMNCVTCHGPGGKGDGPSAAGLPSKPADWTSDAIQRQTDGELFWKISNGRGPMPPWRHLPEKERWEMVNYIRSLRR